MAAGLEGTTARRLASLGRALVAAASLLCTATWAAFFWQPDWLDAAGAWLQQRAQDRQQAHAERVRAAAPKGPAAERAALLQWSAELAPVRKLDRHAALAQFVEHRLIALSEQLGDQATALDHARRLVDLDDRDVYAVAALGRLLGADPATRDAAIDRLRETWQQVPAHPVLVEPLCSLLVAAGDATAAAHVVLTAATQPPANTWRVQWSDDPARSTWLLPRRLGANGIAARFTIDEPVHGLRLRLPPFRALALRDVRLRIDSLDGTVEQVLATTPHRLVSMREENGAWIAYGAADPAIELPATSIAAGPCTFELSATTGEIVADWLRDLLLGSTGQRIAAEAHLDDQAAQRFGELRDGARRQAQSGKR